MDAAVIPEDLAAMPPGAGLSAALCAIKLSRIANDQILQILQAQYRQLCHEQARMAAVIAEVGRCEGHSEPGQITRLDTPEYHASEETRAALRFTRRAAECEHELAEKVVHGMPGVFTAWLAGDLDRQRVLVFDRYLTGLTQEQVASICRVAVPRAPKLTTGQLAVLLRRMVIAVDPEAAARWYRKGVRERNVFAHLAHDGTVTLSANGLPADEAEAACVRLQDLAAAAKRAGHPGLIGQIRCDLYLGMLDGRFHHMTRDQIITTLIAGHHETGPTGTAADQNSGLVPATGGNQPAQSTSDNHNSPDDEPDDVIPTDNERGDDQPSDDGAASTGTSTSADDVERTGDAPVRDERVGIEIRVGLATLLGHDQHPAEIPGLGLLIAPDARHRVGMQRRAEWRFAVTDTNGHLVLDGLTRRRPRSIRRDGPPAGIVELHVPLTLLEELAAGGVAASGEWAGVVADIADQYTRRDRQHQDLNSRPDARLPGAALRRHTEIRDRTCTFIGCRRSASSCEQDHTRDHSHGGDTVTTNLSPCCPHDHDVKHNGGWRVTQPEPGTFVWTSPLGGVYQTGGETFLPPMPDPEPIELGPTFDEPTLMLDGPILSRPPPKPPRPPTPPPKVYPDEPPF